MVCNECGAQLKSGATECAECGAALPQAAQRETKGESRARPQAQRAAVPAKSKGFAWATATVAFIAGVFVGYLIFSGKPASTESRMPAAHPPVGGMGMGGMGGAGGKVAPPLPPTADMSALPEGHPDISSMMKAREADQEHSEDDGHDHGSDDVSPPEGDAQTETEATGASDANSASD